MISMVPAMMLVTIILAYAATYSPEPYEPQLSRVLSENLMMQHEGAIREALDLGLTSGSISISFDGPIRRMGNWQSDVISGGHRTVVLTYVPAADEDEEDANFAISDIAAQDFEYERMAMTYSGVFTPAATGSGGYIGRGEFTDISLPLDDGQSAIITVINNEYAPAGG